MIGRSERSVKFCGGRNHKLAFLIALCLLPGFAIPADSDRPNILWLTAEDLSPALGCYGDPDAITPNIDQLANRSLRYTHAFASSPVCSTSRACLINGLPAPMQGTHPMRSKFPIPESMSGFPTLLRKAGYYTSNNVKTDYNSANANKIIASAWDENSETADWRKAKARQPFFCVINFMVSHQSRSMVWGYDQFQKEVQSQLDAGQIHRPEKIQLPPYYPDTPLVRKTAARFHDCVTALDKQVGEVLRRLEEDGHADDTIIFFFSDHGSGMPRHKRALFDSGMRVPLLIHLPERFKHLSSKNPGDVVDRLVTFEDFGPTVLNLAGTGEVPTHMTGTPFLGRQPSDARKYVFGHRDRVDEIMDLARSVRDQRFLYIRNYMPHLGYNQQSAWTDQADVRKDFYRIAESKSASPAQWQYVGPTRPREELYDCREDPLNLNNLVGNQEFSSELERLRRVHRKYIERTIDLGFIPEPELRKIASTTTPYEWARGGMNADHKKVIEAASLVGLDAFDRFEQLIGANNPSIRYWGCVGLAATDSIPSPLARKLERLLSDESEIVRIEAANALARHGQVKKSLPTLSRMLDHENLTVVLHAARTTELLHQTAAPLHKKMLTLNGRMKRLEGDEAWFVEFSTSGFLARVSE